MRGSSNVNRLALNSGQGESVELSRIDGQH